MPNALDPQSPGPPERAIGESAGGIGLDVLSRIAQAAWNMATVPQRLTNESERMRYGVGYDPGPALEATGLTMGATPLGIARGAGEAAAGSGFSWPLYHGSPQTELRALNESTRGPLGPGVYTTPAEQIAGRYAGESGKVYELPQGERDIFRGAGHRTDEEWFGFKDDKARLLDAAEPDKKSAVSAILDKAWSNDGYPVYQQLRQLYGGHEGAQALYKRAGFQGLSGLVDGPETVLFGRQSILGSGPTDKTAGAAMMAAPGIRAYHGSPYDFERFDMSKIGTGEGAQAYGHGLYFAENPATADVYKENLGVFPEVNKLSFNPDGTPNRSGQVAGDLHAGISPDDIARGLKVREPNASDAQIKSWIDEGHAKLKQARDKYGKTYEVSINADPEHFLDWDKPLSEQSYVANKIMPLMRYPEDTVPGQVALREVSRQLTLNKGKPPALAPDEEVSSILRSAGIPGIKYLDQGSRALPQQVEHLKGQVSQLEDMLAQTPKNDPNYASVENALAGRRNELAQAQSGATRNYVLFRDDIIDILRKYGLAGMLGGGAAANALFPRQSGSNALQFQ